MPISAAAGTYREESKMCDCHPVNVVEPGSLFAEYYPRVHRYLVSMVHDPVEADDLAQETFLRAFRNSNSLQDAGALSTWLYRIATNVCVDRWRQRARRAPLEDETAPEELDLADADAPSLQQMVERDEMSECIQQYLDGLPDTYRAVVLLHDSYGLTGPEMAGALDVSLDTVKIRLHRARQKLRAALGAGCTFSHNECNVLVCEPRG